jgi:hypothetical protein
MKKRALTTALVVSLILLGIAITALATIGFLNVYIVRKDSGGTLFYRGEEAYLFMSGTRRGFHFSYVKYPWKILGEYLHSPLPKR